MVLIPSAAADSRNCAALAGLGRGLQFAGNRVGGDGTHHFGGGGNSLGHKFTLTNR